MSAAELGPDSARREAWAAWRIDAVGAWCAIGYACLAALSRQPGEPPLPAFFATVAWVSVPLFWLYLSLRRHDVPVPLSRLIFWAVVFRVCGLIGGPIYEDDFYRYLWDGFLFATTGTPYGAAPAEFFGSPDIPSVFQGVLDQVGYPELPTIYAPVTQVTFLLGYWIYPGSVTVLQALMIVADLGIIVLLLRMAPSRNVLLYAWCPLIVKEIAFTAHPDAIGVCLLLGSLVLARQRRFLVAAIVLGLAVASKVLALVLAPLIMIGARKKHYLTLCVTLILIYLPFVRSGGTEFESMQVFGMEWEFNSALFGVASSLLGRATSMTTFGLIFAGLCVSYAVRYFRGGAEDVPRGDWLYGALLAMAPVINPWYVLWLLPFATVYPSAWAWTASVAVLLSYATGLNLNDFTLQPYHVPMWTRAVEFGLIVGALCCDLVLRRRGQPGRSRQSTRL